MFKDSTLLITGGTGSFGTSVIDGFLESDLKEIRIFSRDEKKQDDMRRSYANPKLKFIIGDIRDYKSISNAMKGVDYVFHAAALKQVPSCEFYPMEALKTNVIGTENVIDAAISEKVKKVVCLSTDKAVYPTNAMGITKALMEKVVIAASRNAINTGTMICATRYGNVMASRGSVIPVFVEQVLKNTPLTITDPEMTRFLMTLEEAFNLVLFAFQHGANGDIFVQKSSAATVNTLANGILEIFNKKQANIKIIGTRHGEKLYETLLSKEELATAIDLGDYFRVPSDNRDLNYGKFFDSGEIRLTQVSHGESYNSHNAPRIDIQEIKSLLLQLDFIKKKLEIFTNN